MQTYNADRPEGRMNLGNLYAERRDAERAVAEYRKALAIDPTLAAAYANLADLYRARGADSDAEAVLREGLMRNPARMLGSPRGGGTVEESPRRSITLVHDAPPPASTPAFKPFARM